jgi:hypothetical protein
LSRENPNRADTGGGRSAGVPGNRVMRGASRREQERLDEVAGRRAVRRGDSSPLPWDPRRVDTRDWTCGQTRRSNDTVRIAVPSGTGIATEPLE